MELLNTANALLDAKEVLTEMVNQGLLNNGKNVFALTNMISEKYSLTMDESLIVVEQAFKLV